MPPKARRDNVRAGRLVACGAQYGHDDSGNAELLLTNQFAVGLVQDGEGTTKVQQTLVQSA